MTRVYAALLCLLACACSPASVAEQPLSAEQEKQAVLAWVGSFAQASEVSTPSVGTALRIKLSQQGDTWQGERAFGKGAFRAKIEGQHAQVTIPMDAQSNCLVTTGEVVKHATQSGYDVRFGGVPGRPRFWALDGASVSLMIYASPNMTTDTKETACVALINVDKEINHG